MAEIIAEILYDILESFWVGIRSLFEILLFIFIVIAIEQGIKHIFNGKED